MRIIGIVSVTFVAVLFYVNYMYTPKPEPTPQVDTNAIKAKIDLKIDSLIKIDTQKTK